MTRAERVAKLQRNLASLRSRFLRIHGEVDQAVRELAELQAEAKVLAEPEQASGGAA